MHPNHLPSTLCGALLGYFIDQLPLIYHPRPLTKGNLGTIFLYITKLPQHREVQYLTSQHH
jgi:hypothetical protein